LPLDKQKGVQGSQFTSIAFTGLLLKNEIKISMDGKGAWRDNIFVERLWRTIKYEEVYLRAYASVPEARASIGRYIDAFYNDPPPKRWTPLLSSFWSRKVFYGYGTSSISG